MPTAWLAKVRLEGATVTVGTIPVPVKLTVCGLPLALSVIDRVPPRAPLVVGVKVTLTVQFAPTARLELLAGQVLVWEKSPLAPMLLMMTGTVPVLLTVTG